MERLTADPKNRLGTPEARDFRGPRTAFLPQGFYNPHLLTRCTIPTEFRLCVGTRRRASKIHIIQWVRLYEKTIRSDSPQLAERNLAVARETGNGHEWRRAKEITPSAFALFERQSPVDDGKLRNTLPIR